MLAEKYHALRTTLQRSAMILYFSVLSLGVKSQLINGLAADTACSPQIYPTTPSFHIQSVFA
jgi:hypothetical protein